MMPTISRIWNTMVRENTTSSGTMAESKVARTFFEFLLDADMSSRDDSNMIRSMAIKAPPTPIPIAEVIDMALLAALVVAEIAAMLNIRRIKSGNPIKVFCSTFAD